MNDLKEITATIKQTVQPLMEKWIEDRVEMIMELKNMYRGLEDNRGFNEYYEEMRSRYRYFSRSDAKFHWFDRMGYSKGDYMLAAYESMAEIQKKMEKQAEAKLMKIDVAVAKKIDFDVDAVELMYLRNGKDGYFEGAWKVNGERIFQFNTLYAGGWNVQCLHVRTKYKLV